MPAIACLQPHLCAHPPCCRACLPRCPQAAAEKAKAAAGKGWSFLKSAYASAAAAVEQTAAQNGYQVDLGSRKVAASVGSASSGGGRLGGMSGMGSSGYERVHDDDAQWGAGGHGANGAGYQQGAAAPAHDEWGSWGGQSNGGSNGHAAAANGGGGARQQQGGGAGWAGWDDAAASPVAAPGAGGKAAAKADDDDWGKW